VVDRVRDLEKRLSELIYIENKTDVLLYEERVEVIIDLLDKVTSRSRILQRALGTFYYGIGFFILTSVSIAIASLLGVYRWLPIPIGVVGIMCVFLRGDPDDPRNSYGDRDRQCRNGFYMGALLERSLPSTLPSNTPDEANAAEWSRPN
jgi:hypothetical protein